LTAINQLYNRYSVNYNRKLLSLCSPLFHALNLNNFGYEFISNEGHLAAVGTNLDSLSLFAEKHFYQAMPFYVNPKFLKTGVFFSRHLNDPSYQNMESLLGKKCETICALQGVIKVSDGAFRYYLGCHPDSLVEAESNIINSLYLINSFIEHFQKETRELFQKMLLDDPFELARHRGSTFYKKPDLPSSGLTLNQKLNFLERMSSDNHISDLRLSKREKQCLKLKAQNKTALEIAQLLDLSHRTVEHYLDNARSKLRVHSKPEFLLKLRNLNEIGFFNS
jgi:DNA-binding CsgD family transcriptional regulator